MNSKICVITGCNKGIGLDIVHLLYNRGYLLVMACRNIDEALKVKEQLEIQYSKSGVI